MSNAPRWTSPHPALERIIASHESTYRRSLETTAAYRGDLVRIEVSENEPREPCWVSGWLPALDSSAIYVYQPAPTRRGQRVCDRVVRSPLEAADLSIFDELQDGDMVFFDGSHRVFMDSDVTVFLLEVLLRLSPGELVGVHDIYLPYDYPKNICTPLLLRAVHA